MANRVRSNFRRRNCFEAGRYLETKGIQSITAPDISDTDCRRENSTNPWADGRPCSRVEAEWPLGEPWSLLFNISPAPLPNIRLQEQRQRMKLNLWGIRVEDSAFNGRQVGLAQRSGRYWCGSSRQCAGCKTVGVTGICVALIWNQV